ncbi:MAG TPA: arylesterase [Flavisolibacter sp.]|nr:arylesterase [Flavisolibacter sp.]
MKKGWTRGWIACLFLFAAACNSNEPSKPSAAKGSNGEAAIPVASKTIVFFGNSLTAGYGLSPDQAFPALIQKKLDSAALAYKVINAGVSGETSSGGASRIDWILKQPVDVFVLELGANDGLRGVPLAETRKSLQVIIDRVKAKYPAAKLVLAGMQIPPNMGAQYANGFREIYPELAAKNNMTLIPFLLEGVGGERGLNQEDGIHPTAAGHQILAQNVWQALRPIL